MTPPTRRIDLFCEDRGHELFVRALITRIAREERVGLWVASVSTRGGHGRATQELSLWQKLMRGGHPGGPPDVLVVAIDCNCGQWSDVRASIVETIDAATFPRALVACPDPHVERWCFADPVAFRDVVGSAPPRDPGKCQRDLYKRLFGEALKTAGAVVLGGEMDMAPDIVRRMDFFRAGKAQPSLKHFIDDLRAALRELATSP